MNTEKLFAICLANEEMRLGPLLEKNLLSWYKNTLFSATLFYPDPIGGYAPFEQAYNKSRNPFTFSVARQWRDKSSKAEWKYRKILELLRETKDMDSRLLLIARWLKQEQICEPEDLLPKEILDRLVQAFLKANVSWWADYSYGLAIAAWKPYFERLLFDLQKGREGKEVKNDLKEKGYHLDAVS
jgi:hypothetical protein